MLIHAYARHLAKSVCGMTYIISHVSPQIPASSSIVLGRFQELVSFYAQRLVRRTAKSRDDRPIRFIFIRDWLCMYPFFPDVMDRLNQIKWLNYFQISQVHRMSYTQKFVSQVSPQLPDSSRHFPSTIMALSCKITTGGR